MVLTWSLTFWSLFTGLFFTLKSPYLAKKWVFLINFIRILWFIWDLGLVSFDSHKDAVSAKKCYFWQYLGFSGGKLGPKMDQTSFGYILFPLKHLMLKDCSETIFVLWKTYLWSKFEQNQVIFASYMYLHKTFNLAEDWGVTHRA